MRRALRAVVGLATALWALICWTSADAIRRHEASMREDDR